MYIEKLHEDLKDNNNLREFIINCAGENAAEGLDLSRVKLDLRNDKLLIRYKVLKNLFLPDSICLDIYDYISFDRVRNRDITTLYRRYMKRYPNYKEDCIEHINQVAEIIKQEQINDLGL